MRVLVVGASGTIGSEVVAALGDRHEVVSASRSHGDVRVDLTSRSSIDAMYEEIGDVDAVVCAAGEAAFGPLAELSDDDFELSLRSKLMGQVNLVRSGVGHVRDGGSFTLTTGILAAEPTGGCGAVSLVNAGLEGFVRAAALELPRGLRVNAVSPPWVAETLEAMGRSPAAGLRAAVVGRAYVACVEGARQGRIVDARDFA
ncbi:MAG TPA: short chain dehydrogenase [Gemmatimonadota bacterium]|nr:short chain dehydrogenase [Gemmatimonadota bacterium]